MAHCEDCGEPVTDDKELCEECEAHVDYGDDVGTQDGGYAE